MKIIVPAFLVAFVAANLIVKHFGAPGLIFSSALLIPFDFVCRCIIHEKYKGLALVGMLGGLTIAAALITIAINFDAKNIAFASVAGFMAAQIGAGVYYQHAKRRKKSYFIKVNISDLIAIVFDSIIFQLVAFSAFSVGVTAGQIVIKFAGGLLWYFILFKIIQVQNFKLYERKNINSCRNVL